MLNPGLTTKESFEFYELKQTLFKGSLFVEFDKKTLASKDFKRYNTLLLKKMNYLKNKRENNLVVSI